MANRSIGFRRVPVQTPKLLPSGLSHLNALIKGVFERKQSEVELQIIPSDVALHNPCTQ
jgi:hypothetical protein